MRGGRPASAAPTQQGIALVSVLATMTLLMALGAGAVLATMIEARIVAVYGDHQAARYAAEAAAQAALQELGDRAAWPRALDGALRSSRWSGAASRVALPDRRLLDLRQETSLLRCGRVSTCPAGRMDAVTAGRPWGANNPRWQLYLHGPLARVLGDEGAKPDVYVAAWVGDDPSEVDGDPLRDGPGPGEGRLLVRARGYGPRRVAATVEVLARLDPAAAPDRRARVLVWHELR